MRERVEKVTDCGSQVWVSTFHSTCGADSSPLHRQNRVSDQILRFMIRTTRKSVNPGMPVKKLNIDTKMLKERTI